MKAEFERRLRKARHAVWKTVVRTDDELATLEAHTPRDFADRATAAAVEDLLSRLDGRERHLLDEIGAAQARLAAGSYGACEGCATPIPVARLRALPTARLCLTCERVAEGPARR